MDVRQWKTTTGIQRLEWSWLTTSVPHPPDFNLLAHPMILHNALAFLSNEWVPSNSLFPSNCCEMLHFEFCLRTKWPFTGIRAYNLIFNNSSLIGNSFLVGL